MKSKIISLMLSAALTVSIITGYGNSSAVTSTETIPDTSIEEATINYLEADDGLYHNYKNGTTDISTDASLFDELSDKYFNSEVLNFQSAGIASDGTPHLAGAVYAAYSGDDLYNITSYYVFDSETSGSTQTPDGISGLPFTYELNGEDIVFHFASADDITEAKFTCDSASFPTITFTGDNATGSEKITLICLCSADPVTFDAIKYYDNDNNLYMHVKSFDETSLTGDLYRKEKIKVQYVDNAEIGSNIYSVNGTQFQVVSFEDVNKAINYATDEEFKKDVVGTTRFDGFLVKFIEGNVTFKIKENCEITLCKFVEDGDSGSLERSPSIIYQKPYAITPAIAAIIIKRIGDIFLFKTLRNPK